ncbi:hypothetical protein LUZ60_011380 [Juncus effusus]|nr:hypothetical protein LUZ60_011380 [Juncus effusus]
MAMSCSPDICGWLTGFSRLDEWSENSFSLNICTYKSTNDSLAVIIKRSPKNQSLSFSFIINPDLDIPISLWASNSFKIKPHSTLNEDILHDFFNNIVSSILKYGPHGKYPFDTISVESCDNLPDIFNLSFLTLAFLVCVYETPEKTRHDFIKTIWSYISNPKTCEAKKQLMLVLGLNLEEQWMRSVNLGITNWIVELKASNKDFLSPLPSFSYAISANMLWKVQQYHPMVATITENTDNLSKDERLNFSLNFNHFESVIQFRYKLSFEEDWVDVKVNVDNIRCDLIRLVSETLMERRGYSSDEKHFPSRISLQLTPSLQSEILSVTVSKSTDNPVSEIEVGKTLESSFDPPKSISITISSTETVTMSLKPWKFEQSIYGDSAIFNWFLHDANGKEVFSSKPPKFAFWRPISWFQNRYRSPYRPFTRDGGVIFAGDEYGESVCWKVSEGAIGKTIQFEIKGKIWLTYWPNKRRTFHSETRWLEFKELVYLSIEK